MLHAFFHQVTLCEGLRDQAQRQLGIRNSLAIERDRAHQLPHPGRNGKMLWALDKLHQRRLTEVALVSNPTPCYNRATSVSNPTPLL